MVLVNLELLDIIWLIDYAQLSGVAAPKGAAQPIKGGGGSGSDEEIEANKDKGRGIFFMYVSSIYCVILIFLYFCSPFAHPDFDRA